MKKSIKDIDILCVGETLVDFIGHQTGVLINNTRDYHRYLGGSPTNVAMNAARLGLKSKMIATVGNDGLGEYILKRFNEIGVDTGSIKTIENKPTSAIFVSRSEGTPDFLPYRKADYFISEDQISKEILSKSKIYHTTCFALSKNPAQSTILKKAEEAYKLGCKLSIDVNFSDKIWADREEAIHIIKAYSRFNPLIKISEDDMLRLFEENLPQKQIFNFFHSAGANTVCLTLGKKGVKLSQKALGVTEMPSTKLKKIVDTTGAGDAFWSGFLFAYIKEKPIDECLRLASKLAALKLQNVGRLPDNINILSELL